MRAEVKYQAIYKNRYSYSIAELCRFFEVSRGGYYKWLRKIGEPSPDLELATMIEECQNKVKYTYGCRRVMHKYGGANRITKA